MTNRKDDMFRNRRRIVGERTQMSLDYGECVLESYHMASKRRLDEPGDGMKKPQKREYIRRKEADIDAFRRA